MRFRIPAQKNPLLVAGSADNDITQVHKGNFLHMTKPFFFVRL